MDCMEFIEKLYNIKLLPHQKEIIKMILSKEKLYVCYHPRSGYSYYLKLVEEVHKILYGGKNED